MASRDYTIVYKVDATAALSGIRQLTSLLKGLEAQADLTNAKMKALGVGVSTPLAAASRSATALTGNLNKLESQAKDTAAALNGVGAAAGSLPAPTAAAGTSVNTFGGSLLALRAGMFVVGQVTKGIDALAEAAAKARAFQDTGAEKGLGMRDKAREYANLVGADSPNDAVIGQLFKLGRAGGMSYNEAVQYGEQFRGSSPAGLQKGNVGDGKRPGESQADYEKRVEPITSAVEIEGARFATRIGLDPATGGDLAGVASQYGKIPSVEAAAGQFGALAYGLNEGRGKVSTLARGALSAAASMVKPSEGGVESRVADLAEMGSIAGVASISSTSAAGAKNLVKQSDTVLRKLADSEDPAVKALGIKDDDTYVEALRKAAPVLSGPGGAQWLRHHGLKNVAENISTVAMASNLPILEQRIAKARGIAANGAGEMAKNAAFASSSITGQNRLAESDAEVGEFLATEQKQRLTAARKQALGELQKEKKIDTFGTNAADMLLDTMTYPSRALSGDQFTRQDRIDARVAQNFEASAKAAGINLRDRYPQWQPGATTGDELARIMSEVGPELEAKGVGFIGSGESIKSGVDALGKKPTGKSAPIAADAAGPQASLGGGGAAADLQMAARMLIEAAHAQRSPFGDLPDLGGTFGPLRA